MVMRSSGQRAPLTDSPASSEKPSTLNSVPAAKSNVGRAGKQRPALLRAAGQQRRQPGLGQPERQRQVQEGMIGALAAEGAGQHQRGCTSGDRGLHGQLAVGLVLAGREDLARHVGPCRSQFVGNRIEIAGPQLRLHAEQLGMADAAVGGDDARAGDLRVGARRAKKISAEKDDETAHGDGLYHAAAPERKGVPHPVQALLARELPSFYCSRRSNGVPDAQACRLRGKRGNPANPLNLIRLVPAEGLDASVSRRFNSFQHQ